MSSQRGIDPIRSRISSGSSAFAVNLSNIIRVSHLPEVLVLAIAALTRFWRLGYHSFWFDEIVSLGWAGSDAATIWAKTFPLIEEKHPPAYYLTLHFWQQFLDLFGLARNDAALRVLGSLLGVLTVLGVLLLVIHLSGRRTGLLAGLLVALSPALVWYSQELRMFQPATTGIVWGVYFLVCAATDSKKANHDSQFAVRLLLWLGLIVALTYALYSYLYAAFALPGIGLTLLVLCFENGRFRWRRLGEGTAALGITAVLFLPLARNAWLINSSESPPGRLFGGFLPYVWRQIRIFSVWQVDWPDPLLMGGLGFFVVLLLLGVTLPSRVRPRLPVRTLLLFWSVPPLLIAGLMQATNSNVLKEDRYYLFLTPFVLWAVARGCILLAQRWRLLGWGSGGLAVLLLALALPPLWSPRLYRENWRGTAGYIAAYQQQSESLPAAGVIHADYLYQALYWYLEPSYDFEALPVYQIYSGALGDAEMEIAAPRLAGIETSGAETLWLVQSHLDGVDDRRLVEGWFDEHYPTITEQFPVGIHLTGYALRTRYAALPPLRAGGVYPDVELVPGLKLAACEVMTPVVAATDDAMHPPSGWVHVRAWWQATNPLAQNYTSVVRVVGPEGIWGEKLSRENELLRRFPTSEWTVGEFVRDEMDVNLNPDTPDDRRYEVIVGVQDEAGTVAAQTASCGEVAIR